MTERYINIEADNATLSAIMHTPESISGSEPSDTGVLILVGGPQYRVGSHRQFVKLSRFLVAHGISSMRLDSSGMGDSSGKAKPFYRQSTDIELAIEHFFMACPYLKQLVLWGLCDAASAILIKLNRPDPRIVGVVLLNPWVRQTQSHAQTMLKHYYLKRLFSRQFWQKLISGGLKLNDTVASLIQTLKASRAKPQTESQSSTSALYVTEQTYVLAMLTGWQSFSSKVLVLTSGNDLTAQEFLELCANDSYWQQCLDRSTKQHFPEANHTFASARWRQSVEQICLTFIQTLLGNQK